LKQPFNVLRTPQPVYDPITAAVATAVGVSSGTIGYAAIGFAVNIAVSAVASYAMNALAPKPEMPGSGGFLVNEVNPTAPAEYVYGEVRKGGVVTYDEAIDENRVLHRIIVLAAGEHEVGDIYLNDEIVDISGDAFSLQDPGDDDDLYEGAGWVTTEKWMEDNQIREPRIRIFVHDGSQTAATDTFANSSTRSMANELIAKSAAGLDSNFVGKGLTYLYVQMNIDNEVFAGGIPRITANVKRKGIYDPRDDTSKITSNWALCLADYLQADYGLGDTGSVDDTALSVEANTCDEAITLAAGGTQKRYEMNGVFRADEQPGQILSRMMPSGAGNLFWGQGKWVIRAGDYAGSIASFTLDDFRSGIQVETRTPRAQNYNAVRGVFNDKSQRYIEGEYPRISSATFLSVDGGFENVLDYDLPFETDGIRAQRLAKVALFRQREQIRLEADFSLRAASVQPGDVIDLTIDRYGWDAKEFEVVGWTLKISESGTLCVRMQLKETSEASFDWDAEETVFEGNNTNLPDDLTVPTVAIGAPIVNYIQNPGGTEQPRVTVPWSVTSPGLVSDYVFEWRENSIDYDANGGFVDLGSTPTAREQEVYAAYLKGLGRAPDQNGFDFYVSGGGSGLSANDVLIQITNSAEGKSQDNFQSMVLRTTRAELRDLSFYKRYDFRVYARNARGARSASDATTYLIEPDTQAPGAPTGLTASADFGVIRLGWINPQDLDLKHIEIWEGSNSALGNASLLAVTQGDTYVRSNLAPQTTRYYWIRASDYTGNLSSFVGPVNATTRQIGTADIGPAVVDYENLTPTAQGIIEAIEGDVSDIRGDLLGIEGDLNSFLNGFTGNISQLSLADLSTVSGDIAGTYVTSATLTSNYYTAAGVDGAITAAITDFESTFVSDNDLVTSAFLTTNYYTKATTDCAISGDFSEFESTFVSDNDLLTTAAADVAYYTKATTDSLISSAITSLEGDLGDTYATLTQTSIIEGNIGDVEGDVASIEAKWSVDVDVNGIASGFQLISGASTSAFNIRADQFNIYPPSGSTGGDQVFTVLSTSQTIDGVTYPAGTYVQNTLFAEGISTLSGGVGLQVNADNRPDAVYITQNSKQFYGLYVGNFYNPGLTEGAGGAAFMSSRGGFTLEVRNTENNSSSDDAAIFAQNAASGGGAAWVGESGLDGGYGVNALRGGYYDTSGDGYLPFTGVHEAMIRKQEKPVPGDILCDERAVTTTINDSFTVVGMSSSPNQSTAVGVFKSYRPNWEGIAAFVDQDRMKEETRASPVNASGDKVSRPNMKGYRVNPRPYARRYDPLRMNSLGEGGINVCGENGNIKTGDLIVTSSAPGKGMRQADDLVRSCTVAKARDSVTFDHPDQVKMIACIYLCG